MNLQALQTGCRLLVPRKMAIIGEEAHMCAKKEAPRSPQSRRKAVIHEIRDADDMTNRIASQYGVILEKCFDLWCFRQAGFGYG